MTPLPQDFVVAMCEQLGPHEAAHLFAALEETPPVSVRINKAKAAPAPTSDEHFLSDENMPEGVRVPWCATGRYLSSRPQFTLDPLLHAGCYYVQEASSMAVEVACKAIAAGGCSPARVLDLCAAPGGKSTHWAALLSDCLLVCNEPVRNRAQVLAENVAKWGLPDVVVTNALPADFSPLKNFFDIVATDVPCSGEGMFRKDEGARTEWSRDNVQMCAARQFDIVRDVWPALRHGGYLVYSTCTFNRYENEDNVRRICKELGAVPVTLPSVEGAVGTELGLHFYPGRTLGEGFFIALLQKTSGGERAGWAKARRQKTPALPREAPEMRRCLNRDEDFTLFAPDAETVCALHTRHFEAYQQLCACLSGGKSSLLPSTLGEGAGIRLFSKKGNKWVPQQPLALSTALAADAFPRVNLPLEQAIAYLRREAIVLPPEAARGYVLVCYDHHPLGFVNNLGSRANNLYPAEWRIRKIV